MSLLRSGRLLFALAASIAFIPTASAQTFTWVGTSSPNWSDPANWSSTGGGVPTNGSTVVFNNTSVGNLANTNDLVGLNLTAIQVVNPASALTIGGTQIPLGSGGINMTATTVAVTVNAPVVLGAAQSWSVINTAALSL